MIINPSVLFNALNQCVICLYFWWHHTDDYTYDCDLVVHVFKDSEVLPIRVLYRNSVYTYYLKRI